MNTSGIYYMHYRRRNRYGEALPKGGATLAIRPLPGNQIAVGMAVCSERDLFNKKLGRSIAAGRLEAQAQGGGNQYVYTIAAVDADRPIKEVVNETFHLSMADLGLE